MNIGSLAEWGKRFKGFLGIAAFILLILLAGITYLFKQGSLDQILTNFGKLTGTQFLTVVYLAFGLPFIVILLLIILSYRSSNRHKVERGDIVVYIHISDSGTKQRLADAEIHLSFHGTHVKTTDTRGEAIFTFPAIYKGATCTIDIFKEGYQNKSVQEKLGKKPDVHYYLAPKDKPLQSSTTEQTKAQVKDNVNSRVTKKIQTNSLRGGDENTESNVAFRRPAFLQGPQLVTSLSTVQASSGLIFYYNLPLKDANEFYGRKGIRTTLISRTSNRGSSSIVGERRIGKTWLVEYLQMVASIELGHSFRFAYIDATAPSCKTLTEFTLTVVNEFGSASSHPHRGLTEVEKAVKDLNSKNYVPVLCIDEFEGLGNRQEFPLEFFRGLRAITQKHHFVIVALSRKPLYQVVDREVETSGFFNIFEQFTLEPFDLEEAREFIENKSVQAKFTEQEREVLWKFGRQGQQQWPPLRLQLIGKMLLEEKGLASYRPGVPEYWYKFEQRLEEKYRGAVH